MNCKQTYKHICKKLEEDLSSPVCSKVKEHLKECPNCKAYLDTLKKTVILYREYKKPELNKAGKKRLQFIFKLPNTSKRKIKKTDSNQRHN